MIYRRHEHRSVCGLLLVLLMLGVRGAAAEDWPEFRRRDRLGIWNETGILQTFPPGGLTVKWRVPLNDGYAGPSVAGGRVFVTDGRRVTGNDLVERALAIDEQTGRVLWTTLLDPTYPNARRRELGGVLWMYPSSDYRDRRIRSGASTQVRTGTSAAQALDLRWVRVPAGSFQMGCVPADDACDENERPRHRIALSRSFDLMVTEITVAQYDAFVAASDREQPPSPDFEQAEDHPVVYLSWDDAAAFCKWVGGRLPTEAEWEYAARGGKDGLVYGWGEAVSHEWSNYGADECCEGRADGRDQWVNTAPVGSFPANGFGLYDMAGNVWEWVADWFDPGFYSQSPLTDPAGPASGFGRVARGGSWLNFPQVLRTSLRLVFAPSGHTSNIGGRCARDVGPIRLARR